MSSLQARLEALERTLRATRRQSPDSKAEAETKRLLDLAWPHRETINRVLWLVFNRHPDSRPSHWGAHETYTEWVVADYGVGAASRVFVSHTPTEIAAGLGLSIDRVPSDYKEAIQGLGLGEDLTEGMLILAWIEVSF